MPEMEENKNSHLVLVDNPMTPATTVNYTTIESTSIAAYLMLEKIQHQGGKKNGEKEEINRRNTNDKNSSPGCLE